MGAKDSLYPCGDGLAIKGGRVQSPHRFRCHRLGDGKGLPIFLRIAVKIIMEKHSHYAF
jgi:hypothetical protein